MKISRTLFFPVFIVMFFIALTVAAKSRSLTLITGDEAIVTGIITRIDRQSFLLQTEETLFTIDVSDMELGAGLDTVFKIGARVAVRGILSEQFFGPPIIEADDVMVVPGDVSELAASEMLLYRGRLRQR